LGRTYLMLEKNKGKSAEGQGTTSFWEEIGSNPSAAKKKEEEIGIKLKCQGLPLAKSPSWNDCRKGSFPVESDSYSSLEVYQYRPRVGGQVWMVEIRATHRKLGALMHFKRTRFSF
jgi:thymidylate synthase ThyX